MKTQILDTEGKKIKEITTNLFEEPIREDIIFKVIEAEKIKHPNAPKHRAGMDRSASGSVTKRRKVWKSDRGRGMSRIPKKAMWRRGTQFSWIGAIIPSTRGGRRAHPPKILSKYYKINKKELKKALLSSLTYVSSIDELKKKYKSLEDKQITNNLPIIVDKKILNLKSKEFFVSLKKVLGGLYGVAIQKKTKRAGIGKLRGRKNKQNAGLLFVIGKDENKKISGIDVIKVSDLMIRDLADNGARLVMFSEGAINDLNLIFEKKNFGGKNENSIK